MVTVREWVEKVQRGTEPGARRVYDRYWKALCDGYVEDGVVIAALGDMQLDEVSMLDIEEGMLAAKRNAVRRRTSHDGSSAAEHYVAAARRVFRRAVQSGQLDSSPAHAVDKPRRIASQRRALSWEEVQAYFRLVASGGNDPALDLLLVRFHLETGARRQGALELTRSRIDEETQTVELDEKFGKKRKQPVTATLTDALLRHYDERSGPDDDGDRVFRSKSGRPITRRRYETVSDRTEPGFPMRVTSHVLRHTAITLVERVSSYSVAAKFAGHVLSRPTDTYIHVTDRDVAEAVVHIWKDRHPLIAERAPLPDDILSAPA